MNRVVGGLIKQMKFKVMKERLHKLTDFLFSYVPDEKRSAKRRAPKVLWQKPIYENNPLEEPQGQRSILGQRVTPSWIDELDENEILSLAAIQEEFMMEEHPSQRFSVSVQL